MHNFVAEDITVDAEVLLARLAFVSTRLAGALGSFGAACTAVCTCVVDRREGRQAAEALCRAKLASPFPGDFDPVAERKEMVV